MRAVARRYTRPHVLALTLIALLVALSPLQRPPTPVQAAAPRGGADVTYDRLFIDMMVPHHMGAVAEARIALERAQHPQLKRLAQQIITSQEREIMTMKNWRVAWFGSAATPDMAHMPPLPGLTMQMDMPAELAYLRTETAEPFDRAFIDEMIKHHRMAIEAAKLELAYGLHAELKALAISIIASQAHEIGMMEVYRDVWYGVPAA